MKAPKILKKISKQLLITCLPTAFLLLSGACSTAQYFPAPGTISEDRFALVRADSLLVAVRPQAYQGSYQDLNSRFFPVLIRVKNSSSQKVLLKKGSFGILAEGRQFDPIPTELILANMRQSHLLQTYEDPFTILENDDYSLTRTSDEDQYYEVIYNSFSYGELLPGGMKEGYLFYHERVSHAPAFSIDILGSSVTFEK